MEGMAVPISGHNPPPFSAAELTFTLTVFPQPGRRWCLLPRHSRGSKYGFLLSHDHILPWLQAFGLDPNLKAMAIFFSHSTLHRKGRTKCFLNE